ncbi:hypothetical protein BT96DRAFT_1019807 [Gymnopus androsaceus JB14]|uniref:Ig-like domain-containing protein n=1 Tax=Gymnopus androsaceus JB14 TaxID=1447944 RepID=A0A6A4HPI6_9AGAR|nr:hypothetical protein BT96DRAFT_1019807 [Gymnopus androsaceus JB14]
MVLLVLANTWNFILVTGGPVIQVNSALIDTSIQGLQEQIAASFEITLPWNAQMTWPGTVNLMLSDGIVTWRACAVWPHAKILRLVLIGLLIGNIAVNLAGCSMGDIQLNFVTANSLDFAAIFISLGANLIATMMIGLKLYPLPDAIHPPPLTVCPPYNIGIATAPANGTLIYGIILENDGVPLNNPGGARTSVCGTYDFGSLATVTCDSSGSPIAASIADNTQQWTCSSNGKGESFEGMFGQTTIVACCTGAD